MEIFLLTRPSRDVTVTFENFDVNTYISTHTSLAGRDRYILFQTAVASLYVGTDKSDIHNYINFNW